MSNFSKDLEKQIRAEIRAAMSTLSYGYEYVMSDYCTSREEEKGVERKAKRQIKAVEDKLVKIALSCY